MNTFWKKLISKIEEFSLTIFTLIIVTNILLFSPYPFSVAASLIWSLLPGFLIFRELFQERELGLFSYLKTATFSFSFTLILFPLFAFPLMSILKISLRFLSVLFLDIIFCISFYLRLKRKQDKNQEIHQASNHNVSIITIVFLLCLIFAFNFSKNYSEFFFNSPYWLVRDQMIHLQTINAFRFGKYPIPNLFYSGTVNTNWIANLASFPIYAALFEIANFKSVQANLSFFFFLNAIVTIIFLLLAYLVTIEFTKNKFAGIITFFCLGFGTDILGIISYLNNGVLPAYRGVLTPYVILGRTFFAYVPSLSFSLLLKGFEMSPAYILSLLFIYVLGRYTKTREIRILFILILFFAPVYPIFHLGMLGPFYVAIGISVIIILIRKYFKYLDDLVGLFFKNTKDEPGSSNIFFLVSLPVLVLFLILYFNSNLGMPLSHILRFRVLPVYVTLRTLILYFGPSLFLSIVGLVSLLKIKKLSSVHQFIIIWFLTAMVFCVFTDLFSGSGAMSNYFLYFNATIPVAILAGIGFSSLTDIHLPNQKLTNFSNFLLIAIIVSSVLPSSISCYTTNYAELYSKISPRYDLGISESEINAYNFIIANTPKDAVFLTSPQNWLIPPLTGRAIVMHESLYGRDSDITEIYCTREIGITRNLLKKYSVDFVFLSKQELSKYGINTRKFFYFSDIFPVVFSDNNVTIFSVNYNISENFEIFTPGKRPFKDWLVLELHFDENEGTLIQDTSNNSNHGILYNFNFNENSGWTRDANSQILNFDGIDDYIKIPDSTSLRTNEFTVEFWIYYTSDPTNHLGILSKGGYYSSDKKGWEIYIESNHLTALAIIDSTNYIQLTTLTSLKGYWRHVLLTYNGIDFVLYLDGNLVDSKIAPNYDISLDPFLIGVRGAASLWKFFPGKIDEVRIYNRALNENKVVTLFFWGRNY